MELQVEYPQFTGRRYGITIYHNGSKTLVPPESFFIGNVLATLQNVLRERLRRWLEYEKLPKEYKLFDTSRRYRIKIKEDGEIHDRYKELIELTPQELEFALSQKIRAKEGSYSLLRIGGDAAFDIGLKEGRGIHAGNVILSGFVKSKDDARKSQVTRFKHVSITGPFKQSKNKFTDINCTCEDSFYSREKQGYENIRLICTHAGALLYFAHQNQDKIRRFRHIRNLMGEDTEIFMPFHSDFPKEKLNIRMEEPLNLDNLVIDVILSRYFNDESLFEIGKRLTTIPTIYDASLENLVADERAGFEVLVNSYIFDTAKGINPAIRTLYTLMRKSLEDQDYKMSGYCLEKRDSPYETIALIFRKDKDEVRLLFNKNFPPVAVFRKDRPTVVNVHRYIDPDTHLHPFSELFIPKRLLDDRSRKDTYYEVIIPSDFRIPKTLWSDYRLTIDKHFPGSIEGFERQIYQREIKNKSNLLAIIGKAT